MQILDIRWLSKPALEAEVLVGDGQFTCVAFSQPCEVSVGQKLIEPLHVFGIRDAQLTDNLQLEISSAVNGGLARRVIAKVVDPFAQTLSVGGIALVIDEYLPAGLRPGDLVQFECGRIDIW